MRKIILRLVLFLSSVIMLYFSFPIFAGFFHIGDKNGPKIYPISLHQRLFWEGYKYHIGNGFSPYILEYDCIAEAIYEEKNRPLFYGLYSKNFDPKCREAYLRKHKKECLAAMPKGILGIEFGTRFVVVGNLARAKNGVFIEVKSINGVELKERKILLLDFSFVVGSSINFFDNMAFYRFEGHEQFNRDKYIQLCEQGCTPNKYYPFEYFVPTTMSKVEAVSS